jgi:hypothetical protein
VPRATAAERDAARRRQHGTGHHGHRRQRLPARTLGEVVRDFPAIRQSLLASWDNCALSTLFELEGYAFTNAAQARGIIFHRYAGEVLRTLRETGEVRMPTEEAMAILYEVCAQRDVPLEDVVVVPARERRLLRIAALKLVAENEFRMDRLVAVERRLSAPVRYTAADGSTVERELTGQPDALLMDPDPDPSQSGAVVLDWKAQPLDAGVLTPTGWSTIGALSAGDEVIGADGQPTRVVGVYPQGHKEVFRVEFTDGASTECCDDHLWAVRRTGRPWTVRALRDIRESRETADGRYWQVPAVAPVHYAEQTDDHPVDPYLLGVLLGDGHVPVVGTPMVSSADAEVLTSVRHLLPAGVEPRHSSAHDWRLVGEPRQSRNPLKAALAALGLVGLGAAEKVVPARYMSASSRDRLALLQVLMDTDGFVSVMNQVSFASASRVLAEQVRELVWSLGGRATIKTWAKPPHQDSHCVYLRMPVCPFRLGRKARRWQPNALTMGRGIRAAVPVGSKPTACIRVAASDSLYVTDDFIVTHNTTRKAPAQGPTRHEERGQHWDDPDHVSYMGYFQQRFYGLLVLRNFPAVQRVRLREFYPLEGVARYATIYRGDLEHLEREFSALVEVLDRALASGSDGPAWTPSPGRHCSYCPAPQRCPIEGDVRVREGGITSHAEAERAAAEFVVASEVRGVLREALKAWVDVYGPVRVKAAKGRYELRFNGGRFGVHVPEVSDRGPDGRIEDAFAAAAARKRETQEAVA